MPRTQQTYLSNGSINRNRLERQMRDSLTQLARFHAELNLSSLFRHSPWPNSDCCFCQMTWMTRRRDRSQARGTDDVIRQKLPATVTKTKRRWKRGGGDKAIPSPVQTHRAEQKHVATRRCFGADRRRIVLWLEHRGAMGGKTQMQWLSKQSVRVVIKVINVFDINRPTWEKKVVCNLHRTFSTYCLVNY